MKLLLILLLLNFSCVRVRYLETPLSATEHWIIEGFCTGRATYHPEIGLMFKVEDMTCRDYNATIKQYLGEEYGAKEIIKEGSQYIHIEPFALQDFLDQAGDEGLIQFIPPEDEG